MSEATKTTYRAVAEREDGWWIITVPELDIVTQARRVDQIEHMARDLIAVWLEVDYDTVAVDVDVRIPGAWQEEVQAVEKAQAESAAAAEAASAQMRRTASRLHAQGLTVRDVGHLLGVSPQRVSQLLKEGPGAKRVRVPMTGEEALRKAGGTVVDMLGALEMSVDTARRLAKGRGVSGRAGAREDQQASSR